MLKLALIIIAVIGMVVVALVLTFSIGYGQSLRRAGILEGRGLLRQALKDYTEQGYVTNYHSSYRVALATNVVTIGGTQYQCFAAVRGGKFYNEGMLAMTTNQTFIWLDATRPPKIIGPSYSPQLFPGRF
jgi:hypothetical protein